MSAKQTYIFVNPNYGEREYTSKAAIARAIRGIVYNGAEETEKERGFVPADKQVTKVVGEFLTDVFMRVCPLRFTEKTAGQPYVFQVVKEPMVGGYMADGIAKRGLRILRADGTHTQISFQPDALKDGIDWAKELHATLRQVVAPFIIDYSRVLRAHMHYTPDVGLPVTVDTDLHLDHVDPPFVEIVEKWMGINEITPSASLFKAKEDHHRVRELADKKLAEDFEFFHALTARLQLITAKGNLQKGAKKITAAKAA